MGTVVNLHCLKNDQKKLKYIISISIFYLFFSFYAKAQGDTLIYENYSKHAIGLKYITPAISRLYRIELYPNLTYKFQCVGLYFSRTKNYEYGDTSIVFGKYRITRLNYLILSPDGFDVDKLPTMLNLRYKINFRVIKIKGYQTNKIKLFRIKAGEK